MYHLKLIKGRSYMGPGKLRATYLKPDVFIEDEAAALKAVASGHFELVGQVEQKSDGQTGGGAGGIDPAELAAAIKRLDKPALEKRAEELGLDISGCKNNTERADAIIAALAKPAAENPDDDAANQFMGGAGGDENNGGGGSSE